MHSTKQMLKHIFIKYPQELCDKCQKCISRNEPIRMQVPTDEINNLIDSIDHLPLDQINDCLKELGVCIELHIKYRDEQPERVEGGYFPQNSYEKFKSIKSNLVAPKLYGQAPLCYGCTYTNHKKLHRTRPITREVVTGYETEEYYEPIYEERTKQVPVQNTYLHEVKREAYVPEIYTEYHSDNKYIKSREVKKIYYEEVPITKTEFITQKERVLVKSVKKTRQVPITETVIEDEKYTIVQADERRVYYYLLFRDKCECHTFSTKYYYTDNASHRHLDYQYGQWLKENQTGCLICGNKHHPQPKLSTVTLINYDPISVSYGYMLGNSENMGYRGTTAKITQCSYCACKSCILDQVSNIFTRLVFNDYKLHAQKLLIDRINDHFDFKIDPKVIPKIDW